MKNFILLFFLQTQLFAYAQMLTIDTIKVYELRGYSSSSFGTDTINCICNGKPCSKVDYLKIQNSNEPLLTENNENPKLHFVKTFNLKEELLYTTFMIDIELVNYGDYREYYPDGKLKLKGEFLFFGIDDIKKYTLIENRSKKIGVWSFYNKKGKIIKKEYYEKNKLINTEPTNSKIKLDTFTINETILN